MSLSLPAGECRRNQFAKIHTKEDVWRLEIKTDFSREF